MSEYGSVVPVAHCLLSALNGDTVHAFCVALRFRAGGIAPKYVVTDGDPALALGVRAAFPSAQHYLCRWHLSKVMCVWHGRPLETGEEEVGQGCGSQWTGTRRLGRSGTRMGRDLRSATDLLGHEQVPGHCAGRRQASQGGLLEGVCHPCGAQRGGCPEAAGRGQGGLAGCRAVTDARGGTRDRAGCGVCRPNSAKCARKAALSSSGSSRTTWAVRCDFPRGGDTGILGR
jgi:hypothetical protein